MSSTIARWDAEETASRLELLLGPDLQFIRINGTVVGALAGLGSSTPSPSSSAARTRRLRAGTRSRSRLARFGVGGRDRAAVG